MVYAIRSSWPNDPGRVGDYVFRYKEQDVGRVYRIGIPTGDCWQWTIFITQMVHGDPKVWVAGYDVDLDEAIKQFISSFGRLIATGKVLIGEVGEQPHETCGSPKGKPLQERKDSPQKLSASQPHRTST
jgi:hypothetical protein